MKRTKTLLLVMLASLCMSCTPEKINRDIQTVIDKYNKDLPSSYGTEYKDGGLLFAHMTDKDYGRLFYKISKDGLVWTTLNDGKKINTKYLGHPDIVKGPDDNYYMITGRLSGTNDATLYTSSDLITWKAKTTISRTKVFNGLSGYTADPTYFGAPKLFYDEDSEQWIITWHATHGTEQDFTKMRTLYVLTDDFKTFTKPEFLFDFESEEFKDMVTIDVIIRKINGRYWAIYKDERAPSESRTGKTILISYSDNLTGPWTEPSEPVTPMSVVNESGQEIKSTYFEAPTIAPAPDGKGWFIWSENYPTAYYRFDVSEMGVTGWKQNPLPIKGTRHGCVVRINQEEYDALIEAYGPEQEEE